MSKIAVVYFSNTGNTEAIAELVAEGVSDAGAEVEVFDASSFSADDAEGFDAFAFGCPACGTEELDENEFVPMLDDVEPAIKGKKVVLFGSYGHGDGVYQEDWKERELNAGLEVVDTLAIELDPDTDEDEENAKKLGATLVEAL